VAVSPQPETQHNTTHDRIMAWSLTLPPPPSLPTLHRHTATHSLFPNGVPFTSLRRRPILSLVPSVGNKDTDLRLSSLQDQQRDDDDEDEDDADDAEPTPQDLQYVAQIKRVSLFFVNFACFFFFLWFLIVFSYSPQGFGASQEKPGHALR